MNQSNTGVSVIIPNYNHFQYLKQRIDSVLNQTFQDFELIILDDCSTDDSHKIIEQYRDHTKVSLIIYNNENSGSVFKQWIKGIENTKGKYVWIAESDDFASEYFLEETYKVLEQDDSIGMVFTNNNIVDGHSKPLGNTSDNKRFSYKKLASFGNIINKKNLSTFLVSDMIIENASSVLFKKDCLMSIDFKELSKFINTGDRFVYIGIALKSKIFYISKPLNYMRSHENNITKKSYKNGIIHKDRLKVLNYYFNNLYTPKGSKNITDFYKVNYMAFITFGDSKDNFEILKKLKNKKGIRTLFYYLVYFYVYLFRKANVKSRFVRGVYYRILLMQKNI